MNDVTKGPERAKSVLIVATMIDVIMKSIEESGTDNPEHSKTAVLSIIATSVADELRKQKANK